MNTKKGVSLFLDSGAFSAWSQKTEIDIQEYIKFIKRNEKYIDVYANLDAIGDPQQTWKNQMIMEEAGLSPLPCFHLNEDYEWLNKYVEEYDYIALGGMVGTSVVNLQPFLDQCFGKYICDDTGMPKVKIHGFGLTSLKLMLRYPWFSVDSTSWVVTSRLGSIYIPRYKGGKYVYDEQSWKISVSNKSPDRKEAGQHIETMTPKQKSIFLDYIKEKGFSLGASEFRKEDEDYELKENEKWNGKADKGKREVEKIIEPGICNDYKQRDEMNIIYFLDLEKSMPKYPWSFKHQALSLGFEL